MPNKAVHSQRWFAAWRAARRPLQGGDAADQGTAFGLEMSLLETHPEPPRPVAQKPGWVRRLTMRRSAPT